MRLNTLGPIWHYALLIAMLLNIAPAGQADQDVTPLGDLVSRANLIVIGQVESVSEEPETGKQSAIVLVEDHLKGDSAARLTLLGDTRDPSVPNFYAGTEILAFLQGSGGTGTPALVAETTLGDSTLVADPTLINGTTVDRGDLTNGETILSGTRPSFQFVGGTSGILELAKGSKTKIMQALAPFFDTRGGLRVDDVLPSLRQQQPSLHPAFVASMLREIGLNLSVGDGSLLAQIACDPRQDFLPQAQQWAQYQVASMKFVEARKCLEDTAGKIGDPALSLAATEALGDMQDAQSVPVLLSILEPFVGNPIAPTGNDEDESMNSVRPGSQDEAEDSSADATTDETPVDENIQHEFDDPTREIPGEDEEASDTAEAEESESDGSAAAHHSADLGIASSATLALGKIGDPRAVPVLWELMQNADDVALHSTIVHSLGLIGSPESWKPLGEIVSLHPDTLIREQARSTLRRLGEDDPQACGTKDANNNGVGDLCDAIPAPEPGSSLMLVSGLVGLYALARRRGRH